MLLAILNCFDVGPNQCIGTYASDQPSLDTAIDNLIKAQTTEDCIISCDNIYDAASGPWWSQFLQLHPEISIYIADTTI